MTRASRAGVYLALVALPSLVEVDTAKRGVGQVHFVVVVKTLSGYYLDVPG